MSRAFILLLDSFGLGATPDAVKYNDAGANTFGHIASWAAKSGKPMVLPTMEKLGLAAAAHAASGAWAEGFEQRDGFSAAYGAARERSTGKDTQSGHWEIAGVPVEFDWGYFPRTTPSFPGELTAKLQELTGVPGFLGDCHASGTDIINQHGDEHVASGKLIIYTSGDSVMQIAAHEASFGLERLYDVCEIAFKLVEPYNIGRVIARPFVGSDGKYTRTTNRHDYAVAPPAPTLLDHVKDAGGEVVGLGKISDIFATQGISRVVKGADNMALFDSLLQVADEVKDGSLTFVNFVDFDQAFGHRRDVAGYSNALHQMDARLPEFIAKLKEGDLVVITADHGCDPTWPGSDHTREHIPMIFFGPGIKPRALGISESFSDIGQTLAHHLGVKPLANGINLL
ncbi:phosphopentomutase [Janthinobacterium agaricidamnosum]|uniref:Phosphopentomutase n=1 Tax=Janthinobacterium agaricidamnosum NBRC 102515 = DSM 9628 TaxID=1349767 RepID=W0VCK2_9BURK|nr:phosphopentomutase [Janthinobacterium agaricidamnosum]CDG85022.1 phosphopentomutase [Janthinobacterium agaricidamnosum NBRC 102515 = DSM 9628]